MILLGDGMIKLEQVTERQSQNIDSIHQQLQKFIHQVVEPNNGITSCLVSGSISRGDYWPGKYGGAVDLIFIVQEKFGE